MTTPPLVGPELDELARGALVGADQRTYLEFRRSLTPRWGRVWLQFLPGHFALVGLTVGIFFSGNQLPRSLGTAIAGGICIGYVLHYLVLFQHEAAHFNLAPGRRLNDAACDALIGVLIGEGIKSYRKVHLAHHRYLGTTQDTERSYFEAIDTRFIFESATGIRLLRIWRARARQTGEVTTHLRRFVSPTLTAAAVLNGTIVLGALVSGRWPLSVAWTLGVLVFLPLFNSTRQVLEHRSFAADDNVNYSAVDHGKINRLFGAGPLASTFGGAGFNRHMLHHWDPGVSFTRLGDLENFLDGTVAASALERSRSTYLGAMRRLVAL